MLAMGDCWVKLIVEHGPCSQLRSARPECSGQALGDPDVAIVVIVSLLLWIDGSRTARTEALVKGAAAGRREHS